MAKKFACSRCKKSFDKSEMKLDNRRPDGVSTQCRGCASLVSIKSQVKHGRIKNSRRWKEIESEQNPE